MKLTAKQIGIFLERKEDERVEFKRATSALPENIWETYSAFCTTVTRPENGVEPDQNLTRTRPEPDQKCPKSAPRVPQKCPKANDDSDRGDNKQETGDNKLVWGDNKVDNNVGRDIKVDNKVDNNARGDNKVDIKVDNKVDNNAGGDIKVDNKVDNNVWDDTVNDTVKHPQTRTRTTTPYNIRTRPVQHPYKKRRSRLGRVMNRVVVSYGPLNGLKLNLLDLEFEVNHFREAFAVACNLAAHKHGMEAARKGGEK